MLIKGIGYFTVARWELSESKEHPNTIRKPVFVIDEKLANDFNLKRTRPYNSGTVSSFLFKPNNYILTYINTKKKDDSKLKSKL